MGKKKKKSALLWRGRQLLHLAQRKSSVPKSWRCGKIKYVKTGCTECPGAHPPPDTWGASKALPEKGLGACGPPPLHFKRLIWQPTQNSNTHQTVTGHFRVAGTLPPRKPWKLSDGGNQTSHRGESNRYIFWTRCWCPCVGGRAVCGGCWGCGEEGNSRCSTLRRPGKILEPP